MGRGCVCRAIPSAKVGICQQSPLLFAPLALDGWGFPHASKPSCGDQIPWGSCMSWGERSCKHKPCPIPDECSFSTCNVDCRMYEWDGKTEPDSRSRKNGNNFGPPIVDNMIGLAKNIKSGKVDPREIRRQQHRKKNRKLW